MTFLEVQLERVSAACLAEQKHAEMLQDLKTKSSQHDEKLSNLTKLVKLLQSFTDGQEAVVDKM